MLVAINLISDSQIYFNLKRTASKGLISLLDKNKLHNLAWKYFKAKDSFGNTIGYMCPYSGKIIHNPKDIVLEHIIPVDSNGGTVLFNCIPTSSEVNKLSEKGAKHLISWWKNSAYWDTTAPKRLESIVNYMLDAYDIVFKEYTLDEVEESYLNIDGINNDIGNNSDLSVDERKESKELKEQAKSNGITSYLGFILDCINELERNNINTDNIRNRLQSLSDKNIFKDVNKYEMYQNIIQRVIKESLGNDNNKYLTYSLNIDVKKLMNFINLDNENDIYSEIRNRISYIINILNQNNISLIDYYDNLRDIEDIDILYKDINSLSEEDINSFIANCKIGYKTKIKVFIEMLNQEDRKYTSYEKGEGDSNNIFVYRNEIMFKGYEQIIALNTKRFWGSNAQKIEELLNKGSWDGNVTEETLKYKGSEYDRARQAIKEYKFIHNKFLREQVFIEMLNNNNNKFTSYGRDSLGRIIGNLNNIFVGANIIPFKGYEKIEGLNTSHFWVNNSNEIKELLFKGTLNGEETEKSRKYLEPKYDRARQAIKEWSLVNSNNPLLRQNEYIEMLNRDDRKYTSYKKGEGDSNNIFVKRNKISFVGHEEIDGLNTSNFWINNSYQIKELLFKGTLKGEETEKTRKYLEPKYDRAREAIKEYEFVTNKFLREQVFIDMLNQEDRKYTSYENGNGDSNNIFVNLNKVSFKDYQNIEGLNTSLFWEKNSNEIKELLTKGMLNGEKTEETRKYLESKYDRAREAIKEYEFATNIFLREQVFIEMLNQGDRKYTSYEKGKGDSNNIFVSLNKVLFKDYKNIEGLNTRYFWSHNCPQIKELLFKGTINKEETEESSKYLEPKYDRAREAIKEYEFVTNKFLREQVFIEMLNQEDRKYTSYEKGKGDSNNIFVTLNEVLFKDYENIGGLNTSGFWSKNSPDIIKMLFYDKEYASDKYDMARYCVLERLKVSTIDEYIEKLDASKKKNKALIEIRNKLINEKEELVKENHALKNEISSSYLEKETDTRRMVM